MWMERRRFLGVGVDTGLLLHSALRGRRAGRGEDRAAAGGRNKQVTSPLAVVVKTNGIPFWARSMLEPTLVGIGMFTGGTIWILTHGPRTW